MTDLGVENEHLKGTLEVAETKVLVVNDLQKEVALLKEQLRQADETARQ